MIACPICLTGIEEPELIGKWASCKCRRLAHKQHRGIWQFSIEFWETDQVLELRPDGLYFLSEDSNFHVDWYLVPESEKMSSIRRVIELARTREVMDL